MLATGSPPKLTRQALHNTLGDAFRDRHPVPYALAQGTQDRNRAAAVTGIVAKNPTGHLMHPGQGLPRTLPSRRRGTARLRPPGRRPG